MDRPRLHLSHNIVRWAGPALAIALASPAMADPGDKAGWSVNVDPRRRAFLQWVPEEGGPRVLMLGCLRDAGTFTTMSYSVGERDEIEHVKLTLSTDHASFTVDGRITRYETIRRSSFISDLDVNDDQLGAIGRQLLPVLEATGDVTMTIIPGSPSGAAKTVALPTTGLATALDRFRTVCFR